MVSGDLGTSVLIHGIWAARSMALISLPTPVQQTLRLLPAPFLPHFNELFLLFFFFSPLVLACVNFLYEYSLTNLCGNVSVSFHTLLFCGQCQLQQREMWCLSQRVEYKLCSAGGLPH